MAALPGNGGDKEDDRVSAAVVALNIKSKFQKKKKDHGSHSKQGSSSSSGSGGNSLGGDGGRSYFVRDRHWKYIEKAYRCDLTTHCQWQGN